MNDAIKRTAEHYTKQWGAQLDFKSFVKANPEAAKVMPRRQLGWPDLFSRIRAQASEGSINVLDAACGFGDILRILAAEPAPAGLRYVGADIHDSLNLIETPANASLVQWDISDPLPGGENFDYVICRAAIHHTPDPEKTFRSLVSQLKSGGTIAITAYTKKSPMREAIDDALREKVVPLSNDAAFAVANQFTALGRDLQNADGLIEIAQDLPFLGIKAGTYKVQEFIYKYFMKCWHNPAFSEAHCDVVNFDWYHPPFAYRYDMSELERWAADSGLTVTKRASIDAQNYMEAVF